MGIKTKRANRNLYGELMAELRAMKLIASSAA